MSVSSRFLLVLLLSYCATAQALERRYLASMDNSHWKLAEYSSTLCRIEHQIPRFGVAVFTQQAGRGLQLELITQHRFKKGINVELRSESTSWNARQTRTVLSRFETNGRKSLFKIPSAVAEQVFHELSSGFQPGFLFYEEYPLIASLSNVRFGRVAAGFTQCIDELYADNFNDVRVSAIHFAPDDEFASIKEEQSAFKRMLEYLQIDDSISEIVVTGHADHTGLACYNEGLSERRAWYVYDLLIARGIDSSLLRVNYLGEQKPASKGGKKSALAANRRVTVELRR
jgi:outer membrane protein OmpA-like peptidoglycan-associated protein